MLCKYYVLYVKRVPYTWIDSVINVPGQFPQRHFFLRLARTTCTLLQRCSKEVLEEEATHPLRSTHPRTLLP